MRKCSCRSGLRRRLLKITLDITAVLATVSVPAKALWSQPVHPIEVTPITPDVAIYVPPDRTCTEEKLREVRGAGVGTVPPGGHGRGCIYPPVPASSIDRACRRWPAFPRANGGSLAISTPTAPMTS